MYECYITFETMTAGQRAEHLLRQNGVPARLVRTPQVIAQRGCGASVVVEERHLTQAVQYLRQRQAPMRGVYRREHGGEFQAVQR